MRYCPRTELHACTYFTVYAIEAERILFVTNILCTLFITNNLERTI